MPTSDSELLQVLAEGAARGVVVGVVSQCVDGRVDLNAYATSEPLLQAGAVGGFDMTTEAAYAKLVVLLSEGRAPDDVRAPLHAGPRGRAQRVAVDRLDNALMFWKDGSADRVGALSPLTAWTLRAKEYPCPNSAVCWP